MIRQQQEGWRWRSFHAPTGDPLPPHSISNIGAHKKQKHFHTRFLSNFTRARSPFEISHAHTWSTYAAASDLTPWRGLVSALASQTAAEAAAGRAERAADAVVHVHVLAARAVAVSLAAAIVVVAWGPAMTAAPKMAAAYRLGARAAAAGSDPEDGSAAAARTEHTPPSAQG